MPRRARYPHERTDALLPPLLSTQPPPPSPPPAGSGRVGGLGLGPLCFNAPILLWQRYNRDVASTARSAVNWLLIIVFAVICALATLGSAYSIGASAASFQVFA